MAPRPQEKFTADGPIHAADRAVICKDIFKRTI
jgi:hypothetical protein